MKRCASISILLACVLNAGAATVYLENGGASLETTGDSLDGIGTNWTAVSVFEIPGLTVNFATALDGQTLNSNSGDFGIDSSILGEVNDRFDYGEVALMSFNKDIRITKLDFSVLDDAETFNFIIGLETNSVSYGDLSNQNSAYLEGISWEVAAGEVIRLEVSEGSSISLDSLDLIVVPEPVVISLVGTGGLLLMVMRRRIRS
ncbi:PEP-CTERM sorting domain-containing protein [Tichowtungia aerotolerans]|uniref:PEP-CTERM sorting domain-containing protein n=1 Tax=Tichowtungia aerotolerans TaxID=2697043 RepID=A0A6P1M3D1_9BACT|nr:PEP-CTERM sorting domain-containing protein [Tichowtungia aerotolerans]QHI68612.1 PEP-CTERM sorting domain-containing protein [Tichowtungia aerotolerans]